MHSWLLVFMDAHRINRMGLSFGRRNLPGHSVASVRHDLQTTNVANAQPASCSLMHACSYAPRCPTSIGAVSQRICVRPCCCTLRSLAFINVHWKCKFLPLLNSLRLACIACISHKLCFEQAKGRERDRKERIADTADTCTRYSGPYRW